MQAVKQLLSIVVAALIGGVFGSVINVGAQDGVISTNDVVGFAVLGGTFGAMVAIIASAGIVLFGVYVRVGCLCFGLGQLALAAWMAATDHAAASYILVGLAVLAGVLTDFIARRADLTAGAAAAAAPQGQNSEPSGDASKK